MKDKNKEHKVKPFEVYLGNLERIIKGSLADEHSDLKDSEVQVGYEILYSKRSQRCYYYIKALPQYISSSFYVAARSALSLLKTEHPVFLHFRIQGVPHTIDWDSAEMRERRRQWQEYERSKTTSDDRFADAKTRQQSTFEEWRMKSWDYIQNAEDRKVQLIDCEITLELSVNGNSAEHRRSLMDACREMEQWLSKNNIKYKKVKNSLMDFLKYTSVTSVDSNTKSAKQVMNRVLSSEILSDMVSYVPGKINDVGVLFGIDITTGMAVYKNMVRSDGAAENFLVIAESGSGKSFYMKAINIQMAINGFHQVVLDIDGEYMPIARYLDGVIINMSKSAGLYFDSTVIGDLTGDDVVDTSLLEDSRTTTENIFNILCDTESGMTSTEVKLFNDAYTNLFNRYGIVPSDKTTWYRSKNLSFHLLYKEILALTENPEYDAYTKELRAFIDKLYIFFDPSGIRSYMFRKPIDLNEILSHRSKLPMFIDIVLNLESKSVGKSNVEALVKQSTATYLVTLLTNYFKSQHEFSVHYIEEYQRYSDSPGVESLVVYMVTGNRKRNASTFIITNSPMTLLNMGGTANLAIIDNINNYIIGKIKPTAIEDVCHSFSLDNCLADITSICKDPLYNHTFLLKINGQDTTIVKQSLPKEVANGAIFKTRDTEKK